MKHGKRPTAAQKKLLTEAGMVWKAWLVVVNLPGMIVVQHRETGETRVLDREDRRGGGTAAGLVVDRMRCRYDK